jgi:hypothetical protein
MNISEIKAFLGDKPKHLGQDNSVQNQLRDTGLRQAIGAQGNTVSLLQSQFSSQTSVGLRVFNNALNNSISINQQQANLPAPTQNDEAEPKKGLFDFEEVARNVLNFVGGAIKNAQGKGADDEALLSLFEQATSGVLKGIDLAKKDLAGISNEEIENGIVRSRELIEQGIQQLKDKAFGAEQESQGDVSSSSIYSESANYQKSESGELNIRTRDGDEVSIRFEDLEQFELNRQLLISQTQVKQPEIATPDAAVPSSEQNTDDKQAATSAKVETPDEASEQAEKAVPESTQSNVSSQEQYLHIERSAFSFSVKGELDEDELKAIGNLVADASDLADEFFDGNIDKAFEQALTLGFDDQELTGFALQLTRQEQVQVIKAYESVSHFKEDGQSGDPAREVKPVSHYLDKMLDVVEESRQKLQDGDAYENMINALINQMGEVHTPDLISAINRFHTFNQKLLDNLPTGFQRQT